MRFAVKHAHLRSVEAAKREIDVRQRFAVTSSYGLRASNEIDKGVTRIDPHQDCVVALMEKEKEHEKIAWAHSVSRRNTASGTGSGQ
jgi:hypothetical protein